MRTLLKSICIAGVCAFLLSAQTTEQGMKKLKYMFDTFQFREFIAAADSVVKKDTAITLISLNTILKMKGIAYYYLWQEDSSAIAFREVLKTEPKYEPDTVTTSPKIVTFFRKVKEEFLKSYKPPVLTEKKDSIPVVVQKPPVDTVREVKKEPLIAKKTADSIPGYIPAFAFLPGYSQLLKGATTKGWLFAAGTTVSGILSIVFTVDAGNKEKSYLNSTTLADISSNYDKYNKSYKLRNYSISAFIAFFAGSLLDNYLSVPSGFAIKTTSSEVGMQYTFRF